MTITLVEPTDPVERQTAIWICRVNAWLNPDTGLPEPDAETSRKLWVQRGNDLPLSKWLWMWNHGKDEWDLRPRPALSEDGKHG